jgi:hypothetical protein
MAPKLGQATSLAPTEVPNRCIRHHPHARANKDLLSVKIHQLQIVFKPVIQDYKVY